jgi:uncharacterized membrane protein YdbT with pleckstrin-like domain
METTVGTNSFTETVAPNLETAHNHKLFEPIYKNTVVLLLQLFVMLMAVDIVYALVFIIFQLYILPLASPVTLTILGVLYAIKYILQMVVLFRLVVVWANELYYVTGDHIICREGLFSIREKVYECRNIRSILVNQSLIGRLFNYGDLKVHISASGGYNEEFSITNVSDPKRYELVLGKMA